MKSTPLLNDYAGITFRIIGTVFGSIGIENYASIIGSSCNRRCG